MGVLVTRSSIIQEVGGGEADYTALVAEDWEGGTLGNTWSGWHGPNLNVYDNTRAASGTRSMKMSFKSVNPTGPVCYGGSESGHAFGGYNDFPGSLTLPQGSNLWVRWMFYFPSSLSWGYCSGGGDPQICGGENDGFGFNKFIHLGQSGGGVVYVQPVSNRRSVTYSPGLAINTDTGLFDADTFDSVEFPLDEWFSLCIHYFLHSSTGWIRIWINDEYQGQSINGATLSNSGSTMANYGLGDYWNGQHYTDGAGGRSDFWVDELIIATDHSTFDAPNTLDSGGRPYITAATRVAEV
jgi:hypothetical protein